MESFAEIPFMDQHFNQPTVLDVLDVTEDIPPLNRRCLSSSSDDSSGDSFSEDDDNQSDNGHKPVIPTTVANLSNHHQASFSSDSDSDSDSEAPAHQSRISAPLISSYTYMHKRQIEEAVLDSITHQLHVNKLPGILTILSSYTPGVSSNEVEIDLSCLPREQLIRILVYVKACIDEQNGGPIVNIEDYIKEEPAPETHHIQAISDGEDDEREQFHQKQQKARKPRQRKKVVSSNGPTSMATLSSQPEAQKRKRAPRKKVSQSCKQDDQRRHERNDREVSPQCVHDSDCIGSTRPKRRTALHKRRLLEDMLLPSDDEDEYGSDIILFGSEQMDHQVTGNQTITHHSLVSSEAQYILVSLAIDDVDDIEEIDIMI
ncbi:hypothetical protein CLU79DRAFT_736736 [Phycomyces nitens]|nr:hypothetical protein CLU79DRAFT_736736 [Phycomyces nitens]